MKVLITGGNGYVARRLYNSLKDDYDVTLVSRKDFDLADPNQTSDYFKNKYFDVVLHCAIVGGSRLKVDTADVLYTNLLMHYNLMLNCKHFNKFIQFGSGAELAAPLTYYGMSKRAIADLIKHQPNYLTLRIFAAFDEEELSTRFIKANILRYLNGECLLVHQDKFMDFFYMQDLVSLVKYHLDYVGDWMHKEIDCTYSNSYKLSEIATMINNLGNYRVDIEVGENTQLPYTGSYTDLPINLVGLQQGIINVYNKLK